MKKIRVKLSFELREMRVETQTPNNSAKWGRCEFYINKNIKKCDYWVVYGITNKTETLLCPKENTLLISNEPPHLLQYEKAFTDQFANIISCHDYIQHKNNIFYQQGLPWFVGKILQFTKCINDNKNYNQLLSQKQPRKNKLISVICSPKTFTVDYEERKIFVAKLKNHFANKIDIFGRGIKKVGDKWDALAPYKYHIALENSSYKDYWTEKLSDAFLSFCHPIYYGCPNIEKYFDKGMLSRIDIKNPDKAISIIEKIISNNTFEKSQKKIEEARDKCLNKYNLFALISDFIEKKEAIKTNRNPIFHKVCIKNIPPNGITPIAYGNIKGISLAKRKHTIDKILPKIGNLGKKDLVNMYYESLKSLDNRVDWREEKKYVDKLFSLLQKSHRKELLVPYFDAIFCCQNKESNYWTKSFPLKIIFLKNAKNFVDKSILQLPLYKTIILKQYYKQLCRKIGFKGKWFFIKNYSKIKKRK